MPKVPKRKLSYGEQLQKKKLLAKSKDNSLGSRAFAKVEQTRETKNSPNGYIKVRRVSA